MSYKVLVVDDSKLARMAVNKVLVALRPDWTRVEAANADEAMASLEEAKPDLAVMDFNMPGKDGLKLVADIQRLRPSMPLAVISANHQQEVVNRVGAAGAHFLPKPLTEKDLGDFIAAAESRLKAPLA